MYFILFLLIRITFSLDTKFLERRTNVEFDSISRSSTVDLLMPSDGGKYKVDAS